MFGRAMGAAAILLAACAMAQAAPPKTIPELDRALAEGFAKGHVPGATVALVENGQVVFAKGYGYADVARKIPATGDTPFRAGSISKNLTAISVMTLVAQHKLALDAPLATLLPDVHFVNPWEKTDPVRLVNLMEHTTGWPDIGTRVLAKDEKSWSVRQGVDFSSGDFVSRWKPGHFTVYNNAGPAVAALAVETASGRDFDTYVRDAVLRPMGMATADFDLPPALAARIARSYGPDGSVTPYQYIVLKPAGSLNVSVRELAQLVRFYIGRGTVDGRTILSPASVDRIERGESNLGYRLGGFTGSYGLGNAIFPDSGVAFRGHNGSIDSFTSVMGYNVKCRCGYVLMANGGAGVDFATPLAHMVQEYLARDMTFEPPPVAKVSPAVLESYAGWYWSNTPSNALLRPYTDILNIGHVTAGEGTLSVAPLLGLLPGTTFLPVSAHNFRRADHEDASLSFVADEGRVYKIGAFNASVKVPYWQVLLVQASAAAIVLGTLVGLLLPLAQLVLRPFLGRWIVPGTLALRAMPLLSVIALGVTFALPIMAYADSGATAVQQLATIGWYSLLICAASVVFPVLAVAGLALAIRNADAPRFVRTYVAITSLGLTAAALYAAFIGWFAVRVWEM